MFSIKMPVFFLFLFVCSETVLCATIKLKIMEARGWANNFFYVNDGDTLCNRNNYNLTQFWIGFVCLWKLKMKTVNSIFSLCPSLSLYLSTSLSLSLFFYSSLSSYNEFLSVFCVCLCKWQQFYLSR